MQGKAQVVSADRDALGRFKPGQNSRTIKQARIAAKFEELRQAYFPNGGCGVMDVNRLKLAAQHYVTAETCRDPVVAQRATRCAEYLLSKIKRQEEPLPTLEQMLAEIDK